MTCISPRMAYKKTNGQFTLAKIGDSAPIANPILVPCGSCMACRIKHTRDWSTRMVHEAYTHKTPSSFITLTYNDENLPDHNNLVPKHLSDFIRELRRKIRPNKLRYFGVGEFGELSGRAHYHAILFGYMPEDLKHYKKNGSGDALYTSPFLDSIWKKGFLTIGEFNTTTAEYCSKYITKALTGEKALRYLDPETGELVLKQKPFQRASNRPGIGTEFYNLYKDQMYAFDETIIDGKPRSLPKAYDRKFRAENKLSFEELKRSRYNRAIAFADQDPYRKTEAQRKAVATIIKQKLQNKKRDSV